MVFPCQKGNDPKMHASAHEFDVIFFAAGIRRVGLHTPREQAIQEIRRVSLLGDHLAFFIFGDRGLARDPLQVKPVELAENGDLPDERIAVKEIFYHIFGKIRIYYLVYAETDENQ